jgi:3-deoxy-manno-octulosonate cytidylyltransferase (CMP-KDO synthetase)
VTRVIAIIPARMGSSRFPGKPLARLLGRSMLEHVYERTAACAQLDETLIATCDDEVAAAAVAFGAKPVMTSPEHERATDRIAEASATDPAEIIVMVQGDEPTIRPAMVTAAIEPLVTDPSIRCVNLAAAICSEQELRDPNTIKTVTALNGDALYFSRAAMPTMSSEAFEKGKWLKQVCVIAFRREVLRQFTSLPQSPLEIAESIDMLRFLENSIPVRIVTTQFETHAVDTPADLEVAASMIAADRWRKVDRG